MSPSWEPIDWYDTPRYYDAVFDIDTEREVDFLETLAERGLVAPNDRRGQGRVVAGVRSFGHQRPSRHPL